MILLDGKKLSLKIREEIKNEIVELKDKYGIKPCLAVILVGNDSASQVYVKNKIKACEEVGIENKTIYLSKDISENYLITIISRLNEDKNISGILVQLPLPDHINTKRVLEKIDKNKDVDAFREENQGKLFNGTYKIAPCTPLGIVALLDEYKINLEGKLCVVIGRSNIVGKPISLMLLQRNATVIMCHSKTKNLKELCLQADIIVSAVGKQNVVTDNMVKNGVIIIDVGMNRNENGKLCGDVNIENKELVSYLTPVPGGVGPMTITMLMKNTLLLVKNKLEDKR